MRGKVVRGGPRGDYPAQGVAVTLVAADPRLGESAKAYSSSEGLYYLYNVPPGRYSLQVWVTPRSVIQVPVNVGRGPLTDVRPVRVP